MAHLLVCVVILALVTSLTTAAEDALPLVKLASGTLRGVTLHSSEGHKYAVFKGIPYARPPLGELRFQPPEPHSGWGGVRDASEHGAVCLQFDYFTEKAGMRGEEDCLFVNVYTPRVPPADGAGNSTGNSGGMPVMVWIHGGAFVFGSGNADVYGPDYLMDENVVVVTLNYRLNLFGFLTTENAVAPGNIGLRDQVAALQWVRHNIGRFGGDPQLVTLFGESAGGASISLLVVSPLASGLFQRVITQSGAATASWSLGSDQSGLTLQLAEQFDCHTTHGAISSETIGCLRRVPAESLIAAHGSMIAGLANQFHPRIDSEAVTPVIPDQPNRLLQQGKFNQVPRMLGQQSYEGLAALAMVLNTTLMGQLQAGSLEAWASVELLGGGGIMDKTERPLQVAAALKNRALFVSAAAGGDPTAGLVDILASRFFTLSIDADAELSSEFVPVYAYLIDNTGAGQLRMTDLIPAILNSEAAPPPDMPPTHGDDLAYLFRGEQQTRAERDSPAHQMIRLVVTLWTNFARLGYPTTDVLAAPDWPLFTAQSRRHLRLNRQPSVDSHAFEEPLNFWKSLPLKEAWNAHIWHPKDTTVVKDEL